MYVWFRALSARVYRHTHLIRNSNEPDSAHNKNIDLLQDIFQGRLLLGPRTANARTNSKYYHALCTGLRRLADSERTSITETTAGKTGNISLIFRSIAMFPLKKTVIMKIRLYTSVLFIEVLFINRYICPGELVLWTHMK